MIESSATSSSWRYPGASSAPAPGPYWPRTAHRNTSRGVKIKTTVHSAGVVVDALMQLEEEPGHGIVAKTTAAAEKQHGQAVRYVHQGKYD